MKYDKEIAKLTIKNIALIESSLKVIVDIEKALYKEINKITEELVDESSLNLAEDKLFDYYGKKDELYFSDSGWENGSDGLFAWYELSTGNEDDDGWYYLTHILGEYNDNATLRFVFRIDFRELGLGKKAYKDKLLETFSKQDKLLGLGFILDEDKESIVLDFHLDKELVSNECPDFDACFDPLRQTLKTLFEAHRYFEAIFNEIKAAAVD